MTDEETLDHVPSPVQDANLTKWDNEPSLMDLKSDLDAAKPSHDAQMALLSKWNDLMRIKGQARPKKVNGRSSVQPKLIRRQAEWRYSALTEPFLSSKNLFKVSPVTHEDGPAAKQNQILLNYQFRTKLNRVKFIDDYVRSTVDEGTCVVRTGWTRITKKVKQTVPVFSYYAPENQQQIALLEQALQLRDDNPRGFEEEVDETLKAAVEYFDETGQAAIAQITGEQEIEVEEVVLNQPDLKVFNPQNVIIDPSCEGDIEKAQFAIFTFETSKAELKKEGRYKNLDKVNWEDAGPINETEHATKTPQDFQFKDALRKRVVAYEYWGFYDIHGTGELVPIVATWVGNTLIRMEENPFPDQKIPIVVVPYMPIKRELYGEPDAEMLEDNQAILGAVTRGMIDLLGRSANSQQGFAKGMLDPLNRRRFENGQDYEFNPNSNPAQNHIQHKFPELPQSALVMVNMMNQDAEALTGVKSFAGGVSGDSYGDVVAGIRGALDAASKREMAILRRLAKGMIEIARKLAAMNAEFLSEEEVVRVSNEEFVTIKRDAIQGEFDFEVDISTAEVDNAQAQDLAFMLQTIGPNMDIGMTKMILAEIASIKRMPELANRIEQFQPEPNPVEEMDLQIKQLELAKLQKEIQELDSKIAKNYADAGVKQADRDKKNLDFVEQENGTKHARDMDKTTAQANANKELEVTKAILSEKDPMKQGPDIGAAIGYNAITQD